MARTKTKTKKAPAKRTKPSSDLDPQEIRERERDRLRQDVAARVDNGETIATVASELSMDYNKVMKLYREATLPAVSARNDDELGKKIAEMRDDEERSWSHIAASCRITQARAQKLYEQATGNDFRDSKGGSRSDTRTAKSATKSKAKPKATAKAKSKAKPKATAKAKAKAQSDGQPFPSGTSEAKIRKAIVGHTIGYGRGKARQEFEVAEVVRFGTNKKTNDLMVQVKDASGKARNVNTARIDSLA